MHGEFREIVPADVGANLDFRERTLAVAKESEKAKRELWQMCSRDLLFWVNSFVWTYNPQIEEGSKVIPFVTWPAQDDYLTMLDECIGREDCGVKKSREEGASWLTLASFTWRFLFRDDEAFLLLSRVEQLVDNADDPDSLFWKIRFMIENQPGFLIPRISRRKHMYLKNLENETTIVGSATTGDAGAAGRKTAIMLDEFARVPNADGFKILRSTADVTRSRIFVSTPETADDAYAEVMLRNDRMKKISLMWWDDPRKNHGLYTSDAGKIRVLDEGYKFPDNYNFILDGRMRSLWYDKEWFRRNDERWMSQQLDGNFLAANYEFFTPSSLEAYEKELSRNPWWEGNLMLDNEKCEIIGVDLREGGAWKFWHNFEEKRPAAGTYAVSADISQGTGASNTVITIGCRNKDGVTEKIAEYADPHISAIQAARLAVAVCRWYKNKSGRPAFLIWEATGPGQPFGIEVLNQRFNNFYSKRMDKRIDMPETDNPGFYMTRDNKQAIFDALKEGWFSRKYIDPSRECLREARHYIFEKGGIEHSASSRTQDPSGARMNHGDRVIASALLYYALKVEVRQPEEEKPENKMPPNCMAFRRKMAQEDASHKRFSLIFS